MEGSQEKPTGVTCHALLQPPPDVRAHLVPCICILENSSTWTWRGTPTTWQVAHGPSLWEPHFCLGPLGRRLPRASQLSPVTTRAQTGSGAGEPLLQTVPKLPAFKPEASWAW
jgi:hypothetical protein